MANQHISAYLNDHLSGAVAALELLEHLETEHVGKPQAQVLARLRDDIAADRAQLEAVMRRLGVTESPVRKAASWLAEKFAQLKLRMDDDAGGSFRLFEGVEAIALGIDGKRALCRTLALVAESSPALREFDFVGWERRSEEQRKVAEVLRLDAARAALIPLAASS